MTKTAIFNLRDFRRNLNGTVSLPFALSIIPILASIGAAVDLGRGLMMSSNVQSAVDQATLAAANYSGNDQDKKAYADQIFAASMRGTAASTSLATNSDGTVTYNARATMNTMFVPYVAPTVNINRSATAKATIAGTPGTPGTPGVAEMRDDSCILSLGEDLEVSFDTIVFNGNPNVQLTNCSLISNKSMKCNGNSVGAAASYAHGSVTNCPNPHPNQEVYPDIYASIATGNISRQCGTVKTGYTWTPNGTLPAASAVVKTVSQTGYNEIHICGTLTLSGVGQILADATGGTEPAKDTVVVIENGGLKIADPVGNGSNAVHANITAKRVTFVLAGNNANISGDNAIVVWPTGNGKTGKLTITPSIGKDNSGATAVATSNPFKGIAIYQHPDINIDQSWGQGASFVVDGIVYFSKSKLTVSGQIDYGAGNCSKLVAGEFTLNGGVKLKQDATSCAKLGVTQYYRAPVPEVAATAGTSTVSSYLTR